MSKKRRTDGFNLDPHDEVSSVAPSEAGTELEIRRRIKYGRPAQALWGLFTEYSGNSTIHGVRYLGERRRPLAERIWWIIVFAISIYMCGSLIVNVYRKWNRSPVIVSFAEKPTPVWQIPFPAVTICPETKSKMDYLNVTKVTNIVLRGSPYNNVSEEELRLLRSVSQICNLPLFRRTGNKTIDGKYVDDLRLMAPTIYDIFMSCKWRSNAVGLCSEQFTEILTEEGLCYTFNILSQKELFRREQIQQEYSYIKHLHESHNWSLEDGYSIDAGEDPFPFRVFGAGARAGLVILLQSYEKDMDYACRGPIQGFKVSLHSPGEMPQVSKQYFSVPLKQSVVVSVRPNMITTSDGLKDYAPTQRHCFFNKERYLRFFQVYNQPNCELECLANYTLEKCGCVKFSMPHDADAPICDAASVECYNDAEDNWLSNEFNKGVKSSDKYYRNETSCNCLPACTSITYETELSQSDYDIVKFGQAVPVFGELKGYQVSRLTIFFKESQFITSKRAELYGQTDFLANCGGLLGLFMGVSILSIVEIIYFCTIRLMCNLGIRKRKSSNLVKQNSNNMNTNFEPPSIVVKDNSGINEDTMLYELAEKNQREK